MARKIFTFAAVFAFFLGCADVPEELRDEAEGKCSGRAYTEYQFCAGGQVYDFCDGTPYNPSTVGCCNNRQYTISTEFCSQNYIYRRCGGREYDFSTQFCSGDGVYDKCNGQSYTPSTQFCGYNGGGYSVYNKCGGEEYSPSSQGCQNGAIMNKCGSNYYNPSTQFCEDNKIYNKCSGNTYSPSSQRCQSGVLETKCGSGWYALGSEQRCQSGVLETKCGSGWYALGSEQRCQSGVLETKCGSDWYDASIQYCSDGTVKNYGSVADDGGKTYKTVVIGTKTWMAENFNYAASGSVCYDNLESNCDKYGRLYDWATAMSVCPEGWHLPSDAEWTTLTDFVESNSGCSSCAGTKLKSMSGWVIDGNGTDAHGFSALPGGGGCSLGSLYDVGNRGCWWSSTEYYDAFFAWFRSMRYDVAGVLRDFNSKTSLLSLLSVRCVQD